MINPYYSVDELLNMGIKLEVNPDKLYISKEVKFYNIKKIFISNFVRIDDFSIISGNVYIGRYVHIAPWCSIGGGDVGIEICDFVGLSHRVSIFSSSDDYSGKSMTNPMIPNNYKNITQCKITLKKHSIVGASSIILPNSTGLEEGVSVGAMSLITKPTKAWGIYFGSPAKRIAERSKNIIELEKQFLNDMK